MGQPLDIEPHEALIQCIQISAGEVRYATDRIAALDEDDAVGPIVTTRPLKHEKGAESSVDRVYEEGAPALHIWIVVRQQAMDRLVNYCKIALAAGVDERRVRIAEDVGKAFADTLRAILSELGVADHPEAPRIVRKHLTLLAGGQTEAA